MATTNYIDSKIYVRNNDNLIYVVESVTSYNNGCDYMQVNLKLVAGIDYINPDENDMQGWCSANNFVEEVQEDSINQYFIKESMVKALENMVKALENNDYTIVENVPTIVLEK